MMGSATIRASRLSFVRDGLCRTTSTLSPYGLQCRYAIQRTTVAFIVIATALGIPPEARCQPPTEQLVKEGPALSLAGVPLSKALDTFAERSGLAVKPDWDALKDAGVQKETPVNVQYGSTTFEKQLDLILVKASPTGQPLAWYFVPVLAVQPRWGRLPATALVLCV